MPPMMAEAHQVSSHFLNERGQSVLRSIDIMAAYWKSEEEWMLRCEQNAGPSTAPLAIRPQEASLRMTIYFCCRTQFREDCNGGCAGTSIDDACC